MPDEDRPQWIASVDPTRPAEITTPIAVGQCQSCQQGPGHVWALVDTECFGDAVALHRSKCVCDLCGRCDARRVQVRIGFMSE